MQVQLADLQQKLSGEEEEKADLAKANHEMKKTSDEMSKVNNLQWNTIQLQ